MTRFVHLVINDLPEEFGSRSVIAIYDNKRAAMTHRKALQQEDAYGYQYVVVDRMTLHSTSQLIPVRRSTHG